MATYGSADGVLAIVPALGSITNETTPTSDQVTAWLAEGHSEINRFLSAAGYVVPVSASADLYSSLTAMNNLYAAAYALRARGMDLTQGENELRSDQYLKDFYSRLKGLGNMDLTAMGLTQRAAPAKRRQRLRSVQLRRRDGYSALNGSTEAAYDEVSG